MVMYTNSRVKKRDLINIANYRLLKKNKKKSRVQLLYATTTNQGHLDPFRKRNILVLY